jgi:hypothetical protein
MPPSLLARLTILSVVIASASGCWYAPPPPYYGYPGNIYVNWTFAGAGCATAGNVATVTVTIPNTTPIIPNVFSCVVGNPPNYLAIYNFSPGSYVVNLTAQSASGTVLFTGSATVVVNGNVYQTIDLQPVGNTAFLSWTFAPAVGTYVPPCTSASDTNPDRIDSVALYVDSASSAAQTYDCSQGINGAQVSTPVLSPGSHTLQLVAYQTGIAEPFAQTAPVNVSFSGSTPTAQTLTFNWLVGGVGVAWTYPSGSNACTSGGVASVTATFTGAGGYGLSGNTCNAPVVPFERLPAVTASGAAGVSYALDVKALGAPPAAAVLYSGGASAPVVIQPGHFYDGTTATLVTVRLLAVP